MGFWRIFMGISGCIVALAGYCDDNLWMIEQEFVKWGKKDAYEEYKKDQQKDFVKKVGFSRFCIEDNDASEYIYLIPVKDFKGLGSLMQKRINYHKMLTQGDEKQILPFLSTINFFIESVHHQLLDCSFVPSGKTPLLDYPAVYYFNYGIVPGNGPQFEERLRSISATQAKSAKPVCFLTWRVLFGGEVPSYIVAVFADSPKEAKDLAVGLQITDGQMKNVLRQEKKGEAIIRKDLSAAGKKNGS